MPMGNRYAMGGGMELNGPPASSAPVESWHKYVEKELFTYENGKNSLYSTY